MKIKKTSLFVPDAMFGDIYEIKADFLVDEGIKGVLFDIDNTVAPYETLSPTPKMKKYFEELAEKGIKIAFVSNNKDIRTNLFNEELGFFCVSDASKPSAKGVRRCVEHMELDIEEMVFIGDQIFTDCLAAHRAGMIFYMVKPIKDKETLFFRLKRLLEQPSIIYFHRRKRKSLEK